MRPLLKSNKKAVSEIVAYALMIAIAVSLSVLVYNWLRSYVDTNPNNTECPSEASLIISQYECDNTQKTLNLTLQNKGLFTIDGFILKTHNNTEASFGLYTFPDEKAEIKPGESFNKPYSFSLIMSGNLALIEVQPFISGKSDKILCPQIASQKTICSS